MARTLIQKSLVVIVLTILRCGVVLAQQTAPADPVQIIASSLPSSYDDEAGATDAPYVIFSNVVPHEGDRYNSANSFTIAGKDAIGETEEWRAILFTPKTDVQAKVLSAAIGYISGSKLVSLGIYTHNEITGSVGDPLPGGQGSTTKIPDLGDCCRLASVTLPNGGVALEKNKHYWLVAGPDNVSGSTFQGGWQLSHIGVSAGVTPPFPWRVALGSWPAAEIRGTKVQTLGPIEPIDSELAPSKKLAPSTNVRVFTNLDRSSIYHYLFGTGAPIDGNDVLFESEVWEALPFTPRADVHAKTLSAAVAWESGTRLVTLAVYSDNAGSPGAPLPGGQASTSDIPDLGDCCELAQVTLPGAGVALNQNVPYWFVASPDNVNAPDFEGVWQDSSPALNAYQEPENFINWTSFSGRWRAAEIRGTSP